MDVTDLRGPVPDSFREFRDKIFFTFLHFFLDICFPTRYNRVRYDRNHLPPILAVLPPLGVFKRDRGGCVDRFRRARLPTFSGTQGLCGAALSSRAPVVVGDVTKDPRYLTTFGSTRSEVVVPVISTVGAVLGLIDVESERLYAFTDSDCAFLQQCASVLLPLWE